MTSAEFAVLEKRIAELQRRIHRMETEAKPDGSLLKMREVAALTTLSRREIYRRLNEGAFPAPVSLGPKRKAWHKAAVRLWIRRQVEASTP